MSTNATTAARFIVARHPGTGTVHLADIDADGRTIFTRCNYRGPDRRVREVSSDTPVTCGRCKAIADRTIYKTKTGA